MSKSQTPTPWVLTRPTERRLIRAAAKVRTRAYAPYSKYLVGAALLCEDGSVYTGCNVENAAYPMTICAERGALMTAAAAGRRRFRAIAVVTANGGMPCGACRQMLAEFGLELIVIVSDGQDANQRFELGKLLPGAFAGSSLK